MRSNNSIKSSRRNFMLKYLSGLDGMLSMFINQTKNTAAVEQLLVIRMQVSLLYRFIKSNHYSYLMNDVLPNQTDGSYEGSKSSNQK